jgi:hypothetical protein
LDLKEVLSGKGEDTLLRPDDILYIPGNMSKQVGVKALQTGVQIATGIIIWRR